MTCSWSLSWALRIVSRSSTAELLRTVEPRRAPQRPPTAGPAQPPPSITTVTVTELVPHVPCSWDTVQLRVIRTVLLLKGSELGSAPQAPAPLPVLEKRRAACWPRTSLLAPSTVVRYQLSAPAGTSRVCHIPRAVSTQTLCSAAVTHGAPRPPALPQPAQGCPQSRHQALSALRDVPRCLQDSLELRDVAESAAAVSSDRAPEA